VSTMMQLLHGRLVMGSFVAGVARGYVWLRLVQSGWEKDTRGGRILMG
jgi:hypothetical protein